jgi:hypothetical protein
MKNLIFILGVIFTINGSAQTYQYQTSAPGASKYKATKKYNTSANKTAVAVYPIAKPYTKNIVYQYLDTTFPNAENHFPVTGNAGIGTNAPQAALEIKRNAGDGKSKNFLLQLSNIWTAKGLNEPSIMFSNGDVNPANTSYWTLGARVSGNEVDKDPVAFKIGFKAPNEVEEHEFFSIDSYKGRVKIGYCNANVDGYKLYVEEGILTEKVKVAVKDSEDWFDHVFNNDYKLMPLTDLEKYVADNKHLPDMPSTKEVMTNGLDLGKTEGLLLKKVEELTLYLFELKKDLDQTKKELAELRK